MNVVKFLPKTNGVLISGDAAGFLKIWTRNDRLPRGWTCIQTIQTVPEQTPPEQKKNKAINCIAAVGTVNIFATGSADAKVRMWSLDDQYKATLRQTMDMEKPYFIPMAVGLYPLTGAPKSYVLAVAGTINLIQIYVLDFQAGTEFVLKAELKGHEQWVQSLDFTRENDQPFSDIILASASQDKYIRLWRIHQGQDVPAVVVQDDAGDTVSTSSVTSDSPASSPHDSVHSHGSNGYSDTKSPTSQYSKPKSPGSQYSAYRPSNNGSVTASHENKPRSEASESVATKSSGSPYAIVRPGILRSNTDDSTGTITEEEYHKNTANRRGSPTSSTTTITAEDNNNLRKAVDSPAISDDFTNAVTESDYSEQMASTLDQYFPQTPADQKVVDFAVPTPSSIYESVKPSKSSPRKPSRTSTVDSTVSGKTLSNKAHRFKAQGLDFSLTFEALLLGHEDWVLSARWCFTGAKLQLLSASADSSLAIWEPDPATGVWITVTRLGGFNSEKGATTATGSNEGYLTGLWSPSAETVACFGKTGSWRVWHFDPHTERWAQVIGISGHTKSVSAIAWHSQGDYLLSTSLDKTTRLHAQWKRGKQMSWHEMARPQIHGYDLNCIDTLGNSEFVSGADEKSLRVFNEPRAVAQLYRRLGGLDTSFLPGTPAAASVPVLGLSNKAIEEISEDGTETVSEEESVDPAEDMPKSRWDIEHPPLEDHLSRYTLWPESEKLYGHGHELSAVACSHDGSLIATACNATSVDYAVIRLFRTDNWQEIKPPLIAHNLTVLRLQFSAGDQYLLSVGRDRRWTVFERDTENPNAYNTAFANTKGHTRMILDCCWAPTSRLMFATAGRDKYVKIWSKEEQEKEFQCVRAELMDTEATAVNFYDTANADNHVYFAAGSKSGKIRIYSFFIMQGEQPWVELEIPLIMPYVSPLPFRFVLTRYKVQPVSIQSY